MKHPRHAFSLVELLVVISIVGVLVALLLPSLGKAREVARRVSCASQMRQLFVAAACYTVDNKTRLPTVFTEQPNTMSYGMWAVPTYRYAWHINQPCTTSLIKDYLHKEVDSIYETSNILR